MGKPYADDHQKWKAMTWHNHARWLHIDKEINLTHVRISQAHNVESYWGARILSLFGLHSWSTLRTSWNTHEILSSLRHQSLADNINKLIGKVYTTKYGLKSWRYFAAKKWNELSSNIRIKVGTNEIVNRMRSLNFGE